MKNLKLIIAFMAIFLSFFPSKSQFEFQTCMVDSTDWNKPWTWPSNKNWFLAYNDSYAARKGKIINFNPGYSESESIQNIMAYEGTTAISDDSGNLVLISNGKYAWDALGNISSTDIKMGDEMGSIDPALGGKHTGSASQGIISIRHPLTPKKYYVITTSDVIGSGPDVHFNIFDEQGVEIQGATSLGIKSCGGIAATRHENGIDIWISVLELNSTNLYSWLLTCQGFTKTVVSPIGDVRSGDQGRGGLAFSNDGEKFVACFSDPIRIPERVVLYDFDKKSGEFSARQNIGPTTIDVGPYDVVWTKDDSEIIISKQILGKAYALNPITRVVREVAKSMPIFNTFSVQIGYDGNYYFNGNDGLFRWDGVSENAVKVNDISGWGLPTIYIPPAEEPDIEEVPAYCNDKDSIIDLNTYWVCSKLSAEDTLGGIAPSEQRHKYWILDTLDKSKILKGSSSILDSLTGKYNPKEWANEFGPRVYEVVFEFCDVNDTIEIEIKDCQKCLVEITEDSLQLCAGSDPLILHDTLTIEKTLGADFGWSINKLDPYVSGSNADSALLNQPITGDTTFDASNKKVKPGYYELLLTVTNKGITCKDSLIVTVDSLPKLFIQSDKICKGDGAKTFTATGTWNSLKWNNDDTQTGSTFTTADSGEYVIAFIDENGCAEDTTFKLLWDTVPVPYIADSIICFGDDSVEFDAGPNLKNILWGPIGQTGQKFKGYGNSGDTIKYILTVIDSNNCTADTSFKLIIDTLPLPYVEDSAICFGEDSVEFDAGTGWKDITWTWGSLTGKNQTIKINGQAGDTTSINLAVEDYNKCKGDTVLYLIVDTIPKPNLGPDKIVCQNSPLFKVGPGAANKFDDYVWEDKYGNETSFNVNSNKTDSLSINIPNLSDGNNNLTSDTITVIAEVTDGNGCKESDTIGIRIIELPKPEILKDETKCPNADHTFDIKPYDNGNGPYTYLWKSGSTGSTYTTPNPDTVWVNISDKYGCSGTDTGSVINNSDLKVIITPSPGVNLCFGDSAELVSNFKASNGYSFKWKWPNNDSATTEKIIVKESGIYNLDIEKNGGGGCRGDSSIEIFVHPLPVPFIKGDTICQGETPVTFDAGVYDKYLWSPGGETSRKITPNLSGNYTVEVTDENGCKGDTTFNYLINLNPVPMLLNDTACAGDTIILKDLSGEKNISQKWSNGDTTLSTNITKSGTFILEVTSADNCKGKDTSQVYFIPIPTIDLGPDINLCEGESAIIDAKNPSLNVSWNTGQTTQTLKVTKSGNYIATASDKGCSIKDEVIVTVAPYPSSQLDQSLAIEPICFEEAETIITLEAGKNSAYKYLWSTEDTTSSIDINKEGTYIVQISVGNCSITDDITLKAYCPSTIFVPNAFTPDQDFINDYFNAKGHNIEDYQMFIYDRWGELIFHTKSLDEHWDGTYMNRECQIDVYVWKIFYSVESMDNNNYRIKKQRTGRVSLLR